VKFHVVATPGCQFSAVRNRLLVLFIPRSVKSILRGCSDFLSTFRRGTFDDPPSIPSVYRRCSFYVTSFCSYPFFKSFVGYYLHFNAFILSKHTFVLSVSSFHQMLFSKEYQCMRSLNGLFVSTFFLRLSFDASS